MKTNPKTLTEFCGLPPDYFDKYLKAQNFADSIDTLLSELTDEQFEKLLEYCEFDRYNEAATKHHELMDLSKRIMKEHSDLFMKLAQDEKRERMEIKSKLFRGKRGQRKKLEDRAKYS